MITKFKIFEKLDLNMSTDVDMPQDLLERLVSNLSLIVYKGKKRNNQKHINYKSIRIKSITGFFDKSSLQATKLNRDCHLEIEMTNKDKISASYNIINNFGEVVENSVRVEVNGELLYEMDRDDFDATGFIDMIGIQYQKYISKEWNIK